MIHGKEPDPAAARALDTYWVTVLDHGMNASTFTARVIASTRSDLVSAITGALGALKGPLHGGAPGPVLDMLLEIKSADRAEAWLKNEMAQGRRIMGFGHRVYKVRDPRAEVLSKTAERLGQAQLENRQLYELALQVEQTALRAAGGSEARPELANQRGILHRAGASGARTRSEVSSSPCSPAAARPAGAPM